MDCRTQRRVGGPGQAAGDPVVTVESGKLQGVTETGASPVQIFRGVPFAAPPVADLRWREPQPVVPWSGIRQATKFAPRCMQQPLFSDMMFRSPAPSEDCLYLNVWTPARLDGSPHRKYPVLVYVYGGGFMAGDSSEKRYDGAALARRGIVVVTINYRLGVFGFFSHPELTASSPHHASGNYGLLDQAAALAWVKRNIAAFGGNPNRITDRRRVRRIDVGQCTDGVAFVARQDRRRDRGKRCADAKVDTAPTRRDRSERRGLCARHRRSHACRASSLARGQASRGAGRRQGHAVRRR